MLSTFCDGIKRRELLKAGTLAGLGLADFLRLQDAQACSGNDSSLKKDINCLFIYILGGMSHHDLWDLKPLSSAEIRGDFSPIATNVPGIEISELLPGVATVMDEFALLRGMTHGDSDHGRGSHIMMTGLKAGPGDFNAERDNNQHPSIGSMVSRMANNTGVLPPYISVPNFLRSGGSSFLGASCDPFVIENDPAAPEFSVRDVTLPDSINNLRSRRRQQALRTVNGLSEDRNQVNDKIKTLDTFYKKAYNLMTSQKAKEAFEIEREPDTVREAYGMTTIGQCCLMGRRLVEAGCRFVSIENGNWDTHRKNTMSLKDLLVPAFDNAIPALINDMKQSGLLESTLVVIATEFGRTPRINNLAGRDHWPQAFSILMGGAGLNVGQIVGATDKQGAYVSDRPMTPQDMVVTILTKLGIDANAIIPDSVGRPKQLVSGGHMITELA